MDVQMFKCVYGKQIKFQKDYKTKEDKGEVNTSTGIRRTRVINKFITASHANFTGQLLWARISE